jgi:serine protease Do
MALLAGAAVPVILAQQPDPKPRAAGARRAYLTHAGGSYLGVGVCDMEADRAKALKLKEESGVEIKSVDADSPAQKAGLKVGDVVVEYNGQKVEGNEQFARLVRETPAGRPARLKVVREGNTVDLSATIGTRPANSFSMDSDGNMTFVMPMPPMPAMPPMPPMPNLDIPHATLSWPSGALGIESESLTPQLAEFFGVKEGVLVRSVGRNTPAEKAGIKAGDVILKVDGEKVTSPREISSLLRAARSKPSLPITLMREKRELTITVELGQDHGLRGVHPVLLTERGC